MLIRFPLFMLVLLLHLSAVGQVDSILALPRDQQQEAIFQLYNQVEGGQHRLNVMEALAAGFKKQKRTDHEEMIASLVWGDRFALLSDPDTASVIRFFKDLIHTADDHGWPKARNEFIFRVGVHYFGWQQFSVGMEYMMQGYAGNHHIGWSSPHIKCDLLNELSKAYYHFGDYTACLQYLHESIQSGIPETSAGYPYTSVNTMGLCHLRLQNFDSAVHYFKRSYDLAAMRQDSSWMALTAGNIGNAYFKSGRMEQALPYLEQDYKESRRLGAIGSAVNASSTLAHVELQRGNLQQAESYLAFARTHLDQFLDTRLSFYENLHLYHKLKGENDLSLQYADSVFALKRQKELERDRNILEQAKMKAAYEQYNTEISQLTQARQRQLILRNSLFGVLIVLSIIGYLWIRRVQTKKRHAMRKLHEAETELQEYIRSLREKTEMIASLRERIGLQAEAEGIGIDRSMEISQLTQLNILTEEDWKYFRKLFDVVYPGFLVRLKEKLGDLTPAEIRILVLAKLQIPQKEMGDMLGISYNSIRTSRYRLRKKLNLPEEGSLEELVSLI
jgi:tetratricopeptide (TPR) repeat protein